MRLLRAAVAAIFVCAAPVALSACAHTAGQTTVTPAQAAEDAMLAAEGAFNVAATAELDAKATGALTGDKAAKADDIRHQAYAALLGLRLAYKAGKTLDPTAMLALTNQLLLLAGKQAVDTSKVPTVGQVVSAVPSAAN